MKMNDLDLIGLSNDGRESDPIKELVYTC